MALLLSPRQSLYKEKEEEAAKEKWREPKRTSAISSSRDQQRIHYQQGGQAEENGQRPNTKFLTSGRYTANK
jgi:hypothetical protein